jgi:hypothetical protein
VEEEEDDDNEKKLEGGTGLSALGLVLELA